MLYWIFITCLLECAHQTPCRGIHYKGKYMPAVAYVPQSIIPGTYLISVCLLTTQQATDQTFHYKSVKN